MSNSVGAIALDIVMGKNDVESYLGKLGGVAKGVGVAVAGGLAAASGAVVAIGKQAISSYADYEQLTGGVETLFKDMADEVISNADIAYKTAGMSANGYMQTVTSFSASLLQSLGGDTEKAVSAADRAIIDMSDNANKMGTSMESIQNAYNGFAKQNYTMLDNLKLGYGGTKEEMGRLVQDAAKLIDVQKELGVAVDANDMSFANIVNAISVVQKEMGIMGTTSAEASATISGSAGSMQAAWANLLTGIADDNANFDQLINNFVESTAAAAENLLPRIEVAIKGVGKLITGLAPVIAEALPQVIESVLPAVISGGASLIVALTKAVIASIPALGSAIKSALVIIAQELFGVSDEAIAGAGKIIDGAISALGDAFEWIKSKFQDVSQSVQTEGTLLNSAWQTVQSAFEVGKNAISSAIDATKEKFSWLVQQANTEGTTMNEIWVGIKDIVDICSEAIKKAIEWIVQVWQKAVYQFNTEGTFLNQIITRVRDTFEGVWSFVRVATANFVTAIKNHIQNLVSIFTWLVDEANKDGSLINLVWENIKMAISNCIDVITGIISVFVDVLTGDWEGAFKTISSTASRVWENIKSIFRNAINTIKGFFNFSWSLPSIKLPHFSIKGEFSLDPPSIPTIGVEWYAKAMNKGMILDGATIFGMGKNGQLLGGGEAGSETIVGTNSLMNMIRSAVSVGIGGRSAVEVPVLSNVKAGSSTSGNNGKIDKLIELLEMLVKKDDDGMTVPIYIGNELIDEYILGKNNRTTLRSGGRA